MSNHLAIATVTAALGQIAHGAAQGAVGGVTLRIGRPVAPATGTTERRLHVYLYQVTPNAALRNADLPTRDGEGRLTRRPQAALDLHYLISFYGDDQTLEPERMLGAVARDLHARPQLTRQLISDVIGSRPELDGSDLASAFESVKFTPTSLSLDELSRLWSVMVQTPHALSVPYVGTVVLIDALENAPAALPVLQRGEGDRGVETRVGALPRLTGYWAGAPESAERRPRLPSLPAAQLGARLVVEGQQLGGDAATLRFTHPKLGTPVELAVAAADRTATAWALTLPDDVAAQDAWAAGIYGVSAVVDRGGQPVSSDTLPMVLAPRLSAIAPPTAVRVGGAATFTVTCRPKVLASQSAVLVLADRLVPAQPWVGATDTLDFVVEAAPVVTDLLVRLRVDGIDSLPLRYDAASGAFVFDDDQRVTIT